MIDINKKVPATREGVVKLLRVDKWIDGEIYIHAVTDKGLVDTHTHGRVSLDDLDMVYIVPEDPKFEVMDHHDVGRLFNACTGSVTPKVTAMSTSDLPKRRPEPGRWLYAAFIIWEECEIDIPAGQLLPYRFVKYLWSYIDEANFVEWEAKLKDKTFYKDDSKEVLEYIAAHKAALDTFKQTYIPK